MNLFKKIAIVAALFSTVTFASEGEGGGAKFGFYSAFGSNRISISGAPNSVNSIGALYNLGSGLEINLGIGFYNSSTTTETTIGTTTTKDETGETVWAIVPGVSYQLGKKEFIRDGAGLDITLGSYSTTSSSNGSSTTTKPDGMYMSFLPYFYITGEIVKNFEIGLKAGLAIELPPGIDTSALKISTMVISTSTGIFFKYYL